MARIKAHAIFDPNISEVKDLSSSVNMMIKVQRPANLSGVTIEVLELENWISDTGKRKRDEKKSKNEVLAKFKGDIVNRKFTVSSGNLPEITPTDKMLVPPAIPLVFEGNGAKRYKLTLAKKEMEHEGINWELGLRIKKGKKVLYKSKHATMIKGASMVYLWNRELGDAKADIYETGNPHKDYIAQLKHHLSVLGFYRREKEKTRKTKHFLVWTKNKKYLARFAYLHKDKWDNELKAAIQTFHLAAIQKVRYDTGGNRFIKIGDGELFDAANADAKSEVQDIRVGDMTKKEIEKWLGPNFDESNPNPKWRSPFIYCFDHAYAQFHKTTYKSRLNGIDVESRRLIANPKKDKRKFVCTTAVNWFVSHLLAIGKDYSYSATGPIIHAVLGGNIKRKNGRIELATPVYYKNDFKTAFLLPWLHPLDPERAKLTKDMMNLLSHPTRAPYKKHVFSVTREVAEISGSRKTIWVRYLIPRSYQGSVRLSIIDESAGTWSTRSWTPRILQFTFHRAKKKMKIRLDEKVPDNTVLLVDYKSYDKVCTMPPGTHKWNEAGLSCKCGLHKSYSEIVNNKDNLATWNIAGMHKGYYAYNYSTLVIHKTSNGLLVLHGDGKHHYRTLEKEAKRWGGAKKGIYYTIFKVDDSIWQARNPCFLWDSQKSFGSGSNKYEYAPNPE